MKKLKNNEIMNVTGGRCDCTCKSNYAAKKVDFHVGVVMSGAACFNDCEGRGYVASECIPVDDQKDSFAKVIKNKYANVGSMES